MIDVEKVRLWSVSFARTMLSDELPYPGNIVEERETAGYHMPQYSPFDIPKEIGGQITLTLSGMGVLNAGGRSYNLTPGTAFLYRDCDSSVSYFYPGDGKEPWRFLWINFMGEASERLIAEVNRQYGFFFDLTGDDALEKELLAYRKFAGSMLFQTPLEGAKLVFDLLNLLCRGSDVHSRQSRRMRLIQEVQTEIRHNFDEPLSTAALAAKVGVSREHLSKIFHAEMGCSLQEYLAEQRLTEAMTLLMKSNLSCKEIARICHFGSYSSFFRAFNKKYNMSPEVFRQKK